MTTSTGFSTQPDYSYNYLAKSHGYVRILRWLLTFSINPEFSLPCTSTLKQFQTRITEVKLLFQLAVQPLPQHTETKSNGWLVGVQRPFSAQIWLYQRQNKIH